MTSRRSHNSGFLEPKTRSVEVPDLPSDGKPVYVTLWWLDHEAQWQALHQEYQSTILPDIASPELGAVLPSSGSLSLSSNGLPVKYWWLYAGKSPESLEHFSGGQEVDDPSSQQTVTFTYEGFPNTGEEVFVTVFWRLEGEGPEAWKSPRLRLWLRKSRWTARSRSCWRSRGS